MTARVLSTSRTRPIPRRGLSRVEAAQYIGISPTKFDELRTAGRAPKPRILDGRKLWDAWELDLLFDALPTEDEAPSAIPSNGGSWADR